MTTAEGGGTRFARGKRRRNTPKPTALQFKKASRKVYSPTPYGFERQGDALVPLASEQAVVCRIRLMHANGRSLRKIAAELNAAAVPTKQGRRWAAQTVKDVLENSLNEAA